MYASSSEEDSGGSTYSGLLRAWVQPRASNAFFMGTAYGDSPTTPSSEDEAMGRSLRSWEDSTSAMRLGELADHIMQFTGWTFLDCNHLQVLMGLERARERME